MGNKIYLAKADDLNSALAEAKSYSDTNLEAAKTYTNTKTSGLATTSSVTSAVSTHNTNTSAHNDIRDTLSGLNTKLNNFLNVTDTTKDQLSEIIALIDANADDIESITSGKVNVADIINNLTTNVSNKPLSAAQGVVLKGLIDKLDPAGHADELMDEHNSSTSAHSDIRSAITTLQNNLNALNDSIEDGEFDGEDGYTPVRGVDYWTEADKEEIKGYVEDTILGGSW